MKISTKVQDFLASKKGTGTAIEKPANWFLALVASLTVILGICLIVGGINATNSANSEPTPSVSAHGSAVVGGALNPSSPAIVNGKGSSYMIEDKEGFAAWQADHSDDVSADRLPFVSLKTGTPVLTFPKSAPLEDFTVRTHKVGTGDVVDENSALTVKYVVASWDERRTLDTVWDKSFTMPFKLKDSAKPWQALIGKRVGTQMLIVAPPGQVSEDKKAGHFVHQTLVYFVEITGVQPEATPTAEPVQIKRELVAQSASIGGVVSSPVSSASAKPVPAVTPEPAPAATPTVKAVVPSAEAIPAPVAIAQSAVVDPLEVVSFVADPAVKSVVAYCPADVVSLELALSSDRCSTSIAAGLLRVKPSANMVAYRWYCPTALPTDFKSLMSAECSTGTTFGAV